MRYNSMTSLSLKGITGSSIPKKELYLSKKNSQLLSLTEDSFIRSQHPISRFLL